VQSVGYDIITATTPDPGQVIQLMVDNGEEATETVGTESITTTPTEEKIFNVGDTLSIRTGTIVDHNGHAVPDGTIVRFMIDTGSTSGSVETVETSTLNGIARTAYRIPSKGLLGITVQADPALVSQTLQLDITDTGGVLTAIEPTSVPTVVYTPTIESPTPTETITKTVDLHTKGLPTAGDWFLSTLLILGISALLFWLGNMRINLQWGIRWAALGCIGGYLAYLYLVLGLPGSGSLISTGGSAAIALVSILGVILGWASSGIWWVILKRKKQQAESV
jgi:beta-N-acetylhexosaminidase